MSGWTLAKYLLAFSSLMLVLGGDRLGRLCLGYVGLGLIVVTFGLRIKQTTSPRRWEAHGPDHAD